MIDNQIALSGTFFINHIITGMPYLESRVTAFSLGKLIQNRVPRWKFFLYRRSIFPFRYALIDCYYYIGSSPVTEDVMLLVGNKITLLASMDIENFNHKIWYYEQGQKFDFHKFSFNAICQRDGEVKNYDTLMQIQFVKFHRFFTSLHSVLRYIGEKL